ncbi:MAG: glycosyltransferase [Pseudomonadota bacterium]
MASIAVVIPCYNEAEAIASVVASFKDALPDAMIYVYDNASTDETAAIAKKAGAIVRSEPHRGKGNAVRRAFADVDADIYVMADGDGTYDAAAAPRMIDLLKSGPLDLVVGVRAHRDHTAYRPGHVIGNKAFSFLFRWLFTSDFSDILSGYRVMSRRFVKSFPLGASGFEIELEMSAHAALLRLPTAEVETKYAARGDGSESKLRTYSDGARILRRMFRFLVLHRPGLVYGAFAASSVFAGVVLAVPVVIEYLNTGLVPRFPTLIVATTLLVCALILFFVGAILDSQAQYFAETKRLSYLRVAPPSNKKTS